MFDGAGRGQTGLDRLLVFVVGLAVLVAVTPIVLGFVGIDLRESPGKSPDTVEVTVLGASGEAIDADRRSIGSVRIVVTNAGGADVDLTDFTAVWVGKQSYNLVPAGSGGGSADGEFGVSRLDGDGTVISEFGDRGVFEFDLGTDDVDGVAEFGERLRPGESVTVTLATDGGQTIQRTVTVPERLPDGESVSL